MSADPSFGTPELLARRVQAAGGSPVSAGVERSTSWEFPSRAGLVAAADDQAPGHFYPRYGHQAGRLAEATLATLEGAEGSVLFASGMAALSSTFLCFLSHGDRLAISKKCYGGSVLIARDELPRFGIDVEFFDPFVAADVERVLATSPKLVHVETPVNPTGRVLDLAYLSARVHEAGALLSVDATFLPPPLQRTLAHGADLAIHSATKFLGGHSDVLAGAVSGSLALMHELERFRRKHGAVLGPDAAWLLRRSLETLELRVHAQCQSAATIAGWLANEGRKLGVDRVHYVGLPGHEDRELAERVLQAFGAVFSFEVAGGLDRAERVFDALRVFRRGVSLGGVESLVAMPVDGSHRMLTPDEFAQVGFAPCAIRLSVGLEPAETLRADLEQALRAAG